MKTRTKLKTASSIITVLSFVAILGFPFWAICQRFPVMKAQGGSSSAIGSGTIIMAVIAFFVFKKYIVAFATEKLGVISAGVALMFLFGAVTGVLYALAKSATLLDNMTTVFLWATIGATVGVLLQILAKFLREKEVTDDGRADDRT